MEELCLSLVIIAGVAGSIPTLKSRSGRFCLPVVTIVLAAVTLAVSTVGNTIPQVLDALDRDRDLLLHGQAWRLVTPLFVQDGGWPGTVFNIIALLALGTATESLFDRRTLLTVYFTAGVVSEVFAYTVLQHQGFAGNSVAVMGLAGLLAATYLRTGPVAARLVGALGLVAGLFLVITGNLHGVGFLIGALIGGAITGSVPTPSALLPHSSQENSR